MKSEFGRGLLVGVLFMSILGVLTYGTYNLVDSVKTKVPTAIEEKQTKEAEPSEIVCSFCGKSHKEVSKLIAGPSVYICDECIDLCNDILAEEEGSVPNQSTEDPGELP